MYFPFWVNSAEEMLEIRSIRQFLEPEPIFRQVELLSKLEDCLMSDIFNDPLLIPTTIRLSLLGCIEAQLMVYLESDLGLAVRSQTKQGRFASSKSHMKIWDQSEDNRNCSLKEVESCFMGLRCLLGSSILSSALYPESTVSSLGMARSFPADFTTFFSFFSKIFQNLMLLVLVERRRMYLPCLLSQHMSTMSSSTSLLRRGSNSLQCDWNSVRYSYCGPLLVPSLVFSKTMMRPALSPRVRQRPSLSNLREVIMSYSLTRSLGPLYPKICANLQPPVLEPFFSIKSSIYIYPSIKRNLSIHNTAHQQQEYKSILQGTNARQTAGVARTNAQIEQYNHYLPEMIKALLTIGFDNQTMIIRQSIIYMTTFNYSLFQYRLINLINYNRWPTLKQGNMP